MRVLFIGESGVEVTGGGQLGYELGNELNGVSKEEAIAKARELHAEAWADDRPDYYQDVWEAGGRVLDQLERGEILAAAIVHPYGTLVLCD